MFQWAVSRAEHVAHTGIVGHFVEPGGLQPGLLRVHPARDRSDHWVIGHGRSGDVRGPLPRVPDRDGRSARRPAAESAQRTLVEVHLAVGNLAKASRLNRRFSAQLRAELGLRPSAAMRDLVRPLCGT
ncbi:hypothetical protein Aglo01_36260 [Actinokineospora globicatena]|nr:hypothetical protein Aglo01_36260 [Actinokineospora globicatena]GLW86446.1 hypothetical protein Aglo02_40850 [Actinokineospora globicatena]